LFGREELMRTLVVYYSQTGNTKKVADAIFAELPRDKEIKKLEEVTSLDDYDLIFVGFPIHSHGPAPKAKEFLEKQAEGRAMALFITHASPESATDVSHMIQRCVNAAAGAQLLGVFNCQGELARDVMDRLLESKHPEMRMFGEQGNFTRGQPDAARLARAAAFADEILAKVT
jgi:flavodoxin